MFNNFEKFFAHNKKQLLHFTKLIKQLCKGKKYLRVFNVRICSMCGISSSFLLFNSILLVNIFYFNYLYVFMHQLLNYQNNRKNERISFPIKKQRNCLM